MHSTNKPINPFSSILQLVQDQRKAKMEQKRALEAELQKQQNLMAGYVDNDPERYQHISKPLFI